MNIRQSKYSVITILISSCILLSQCKKDPVPFTPIKTFAADSVNTKNVTYNNFVHDIISKNCSTCHGVDGSAQDWWLNDNTYSNAVAYYRPIVNTMVSGSMPPPPKFPFTARDRELLEAWVERGLPQQ